MFLRFQTTVFSLCIFAYSISHQICIISKFAFFTAILSSSEILKSSLRGGDIDSDGDSGKPDRILRGALFKTESSTLGSQAVNDVAGFKGIKQLNY